MEEMEKVLSFASQRVMMAITKKEKNQIIGEKFHGRQNYVILMMG